MTRTTPCQGRSTPPRWQQRQTNQPCLSIVTYMDENDFCTLAPIRPWPSPESVIQTWLDRSHITSNNCIDAGIIQGSVLTLFGPGDPPHKLPLILTVAATGQVTLSAVGTFVSFGQHFIIGLMVAPAPKSNSAVVSQCSKNGTSRTNISNCGCSHSK